MTATCPEPQPVEQKNWYYAYMAIFIAVYIAILTVCGMVLTHEWKKKGTEKAFRNNRIQVAFCITVGGAFRAASFYDFPTSLEAVEEMLRVFKDIFWVAAFLLIILFWVELQKFALQQNKRSVDKLRPRLNAMIIFFAVVRLCQGIFKVTKVKPLLYLCYLVTALFMAGVFAVAQVYGVRLLRKMRKLAMNKRASVMQAKLRRLTFFIVLETLFAFAFIVSWGTRTFFFSDKKCKDDQQDNNWCDCDPTTWFLLKLVEKTIEVALLGVLCALMVAPSKDRRRHQGGGSGAGAGSVAGSVAGAGAGAGSTAAGPNRNPLYANGSAQSMGASTRAVEMAMTGSSRVGSTAHASEYSHVGPSKADPLPPPTVPPHTCGAPKAGAAADSTRTTLSASRTSALASYSKGRAAVYRVPPGQRSRGSAASERGGGSPHAEFREFANPMMKGKSSSPAPGALGGGAQRNGSYRSDRSDEKAELVPDPTSDTMLSTV
mmetsp:Transcript_11244/g.35858  ORF Transcript_11244/g.35858 Transcript_11244/m.35858 type:complete len:488 (+) Transcript_11244:149-1612(+)